jgi:hypothetical protein
MEFSSPSLISEFTGYGQVKKVYLRVPAFTFCDCPNMLKCRRKKTAEMYRRNAEEEERKLVF